MTHKLFVPTHRPPTHPGEMLMLEFLQPLGISQSTFSKRIGMSFVGLNSIVNKRRGVSMETALRLSKVLGTTPEYWITLQNTWDLWHAMRSDAAKQIKKLRPIKARISA